MSAILNALKKLEDDSGTLRPWSMRIRKEETGRRGKKILLLLAMLPPLFALTLAGNFYFKSPRPFPHRQNAVSGADQAAGGSPSRTEPPKPEISQSAAAAPQPVRTIGEDALPKNLHPIESPVRKAVAAPAIKPAQKTVSKPRGRQGFAPPEVPSEQAAAPAEKADRLQPMPLSNSAPPPAPVKPGMQSVPEEQFLPVFNDPIVALQAIAWSKHAGQRIAVIDGRILREGDSVEGVTIIKIREEEVIVRNREQIMKMVFQGR